MLALAADENVDGRVVRGLLLRLPELDLVRVQDAGLGGAADPEVLAWAAAEERVLLTHDVNTMTRFAGHRLVSGQPVPGVVILPQTEAVGAVIDALGELVASHEPADVLDRILYLKP